MPEAPPVLVGIDAGTQSVKALALAADGRPVGLGRAPLAVDRPRAGWAEQDPAAWPAALEAALRDALADLDPGRVAAVGLAFQRETFALLDAAGHPVRPAMLWLDGRAAGEVEAVARDLGAEAYHRTTGKPLDVTSTVARLRWLRTHEPDAARAAARWTDVGAALAARLTGRAATCVAGADTCGLVDLASRAWCAAHLEAAGLTEAMMPELAKPGALLGRVTDRAAAATGLPAGLPVVAAGGDGHVFQVGVGALEAGTRTLTLGTSIVLGQAARAPVLAPAWRTLLGAAGGYLLEGVLQSGTLLLRWFADRFAPGRAEADLDAEATALPPGADGLVTLPHWWGVRFPEAHPGMRGITAGWTDRHTPVHMYRSLLEGLAFEVRRLAEAFPDREAGAPDAIRGGGGGAAGATWRAILAGVLRAPVVAYPAQAVARGAAMLAAVGAAVVPDLPAARDALIDPGPRTAPNPAAVAAYDSLYREAYLPLHAAASTLFPTAP